MSEYTKNILSIQPPFDFELLFELLQETRVGGQVLEDLARTWERWLPSLHAMRLDTGKIQYLAVWLDEKVENEVDESWAKAPSEGFRLNALAQALCMSAVYQALPEVEGAGCAPAPKPTAKIAAALEAEGIPYQSPHLPTLSRRFSVLTHFPFRGACEICFLQKDCPKAQANAESFHSVEIPGPVLIPPMGRLQ